MKRFCIFLLLLISSNITSYRYNEETDYTVSSQPSYQATVIFDNKFTANHSNRHSTFHQYSKNRIALDAVQSCRYTSEQLRHYFQYYGYSEQDVLSKYHLYHSNEFIKLIKTYSEYTGNLCRNCSGIK